MRIFVEVAFATVEDGFILFYERFVYYDLKCGLITFTIFSAVFQYSMPSVSIQCLFSVICTVFQYSVLPLSIPGYLSVYLVVRGNIMPWSLDRLLQGMILFISLEAASRHRALTRPF